MSTQVNKDVCCPQCGKPVRTKMWTGISAQTEPEMRARILDETFFDWQCPHCGYQAELVYPCLTTTRRASSWSTLCRRATKRT